MAREWALKKRIQYQAVYKSNVVKADSYLVVKALANQLDFSRFGFSVSKALGKAVVRNHVRRLLKEIARTEPIRPGWDIVFIARPKAANADYHTLKRTVEKLLSQAGLIKDKDEVASTGVN